MKLDPPGYRPDRIYPEEVGHPYPDSSRPIDALGVIRSFRTAGQQMWDEDFNGMQQWLGYYVGLWTHWWRQPRAPYHAPFVYRFVADPAQVGADNSWVVNGYEDDVIFVLPLIAIPFQPWAGVKIACAADRIVAAYNGTVWRGVVGWHHYKHVVDFGFFCSEARPDRRIAAHVVQERFEVEADGRGCRVRNWPYQLAEPLIIERNGSEVGKAWKSQFASGATFASKIVFEVGDVISLRTPDDYEGVRMGVSVTIVGGLL